MAYTTTGNRVFDLAMGLMDEVSRSGSTSTSDTAEYRARTPFILNVLRGELYFFSDTFNDPAQQAGKRPICPVIEDLEQVIDLDDFVAQTIMPYGLAAHLLLTEDTTSASFFHQRYEDLLNKYKNAIPSGSSNIEDVYGTAIYDGDGNFIGYRFANEHGQFSRW